MVEQGHSVTAHNLEGLQLKYKACLESKDTQVLNMYNIFNLQKRHCE